MHVRIPCLLTLLIASFLPMQASECPTGVHPVAEAHSGNGHLFGGCIDGKWVTADAIVPKLTGQEQYRLYSPTRYLGTVTGGKLTLDHGEEGDPLVDLRPLPKTVNKNDATIVAICGTWNALPRMFKDQRTKKNAYRSVVREFLQQKGLAASPIFISRVLRVDLEGDGQDEELIAASSMKNEDSWPKTRNGYYSVVLLRKPIKGKELIIPVAESSYPANQGDYFFYSLQAFFDVNGDGVMEVILGVDYNGIGNGHTIYQVEKDKVTLVLSEMWAD